MNRGGNLKRKGILTTGISIVAGLSGYLFGQKKAEAKISENDPKSIYIGNWTFIDQLTKRTHVLTISNDLTITIDAQALPGEIIGLTTTSLTFLDHYGYQLKVIADQEHPVEIYDEAENSTYSISNEPA